MEEKRGKSKAKEKEKKHSNPPAAFSQFPLRLGPSRAHSATTIQCFSSL